MTRSRSSLTSFAPLCREADPALGRSACAKVWHETGLFVANPAHFNFVGETQVRQLAEQLYGKRKPE